MLIEKLNRIKEPDGGGGHLHFDEGAMKVRERLERRHHTLQAVETVNIMFATHIGKYNGLFARLCIVWHCIEHADAPQLPTQVNTELAGRVATFLHDFLLRHAWAFYADVLGLSDSQDKLAAIAGFILAHKREEVTHRDAVRGNRVLNGLQHRDTLPLFEQLETMGWLARTDGPKPASPAIWIVNPAVHARFAERAEAERFRRAEARHIMTGLAAGR